MTNRGNKPIHGELLQGTLDLLVLKTLALGPAHGHTIAHVIEHPPASRKQLLHQTSRWDAIVRAVNSILRPAVE